MNKLKKGLVIVLSAAMLTGLVGCGKKNVESATEAVDNADYIGATAVDTLTINEDGSLIEISCDDYNDVTFDYSGLKQYIQDSVDAYTQSKGEGSIKLLQFVQEGTTVKCAISYADMTAYNNFNGTSYLVDNYNAEYCNELIGAAASTDDTAGKNVMNQDAPDLSEMSDEELAEAGLSADDVSQGEVAETITETVLTATFTDATGTEVTSDTVSPDYKMIVLDSAFDFVLSQGQIQYVNGNVIMTDANHATTDGSGIAIIVYSAN